MKAHRKGNLATPEGRARHAVVAALAAARLSMTMEIHRTFPYRGQAMALESATIAELLEAGVPLLNTSKLALAERVATHLDAIAHHAAERAA